MGALKHSRGFTIIEVLLVLTVNATLFAVIVVFLNGRQARTEFTQSARYLESKISTTANNVQNGSYENNFFCSAPADPLAAPVISSVVSGETGTNKGCIYLGTIIIPYTNGTSEYALIGRQYGLPGVPATSFAEAHAVYAPSTENGFKMKFDAEITGIFRRNATNDPVGAIAFINPVLGNGAGSTIPLLYSISDMSPIKTTKTPPDETIVNNPTKYEYIPEGISICIKGGQGQHSELTVGTSASSLATNVTIDEDGICQ